MLVRVASNQVVSTLLGTVAGPLRSLLKNAANAVGDAGASALPGDRDARRRRREVRRSIKSVSRRGDAAELEMLYCELVADGRDESLQVDALQAFADADPRRAQPLLRRAIEEPSHFWLTAVALERIEKHRIVALRDAVGQAEQDPRRGIAGLASSVAERLDRE